MINKIDRFVIGGMLCSLCWSLIGLAAGAQSSHVKLCARQAVNYNAVRQTSSIIIGRLPGRNYVVVIPGRREAKLNAVRQCIPDAFLAKSSLGFYIQAGAFSSRAAAESLVWFLRSQGFQDARVVYFH